MSTLANDSKQTTIAAVLGVVLIGVVIRGYLVVNAPTAPPKAPPINTHVNNPATGIAAPAVAVAENRNTGTVGTAAPVATAVPVGTAAAPAQGAAGAMKMAQMGSEGGLFLLRPDELRNPFTPPAIALVKPPDTGKPPAPTNTGHHQGLISPIGAMPPAIPSRPLWVDTSPGPRGGGNQVPLSTGSSGAGSVSKPVPLHVRTPKEVFEADAAALKAGVVLKGVLIGTPSIAFITVGGKEQTVSVGDRLPAGFIVQSISNEGIVVSYIHGKLDQTISIGL